MYACSICPEGPGRSIGIDVFDRIVNYVYKYSSCSKVIILGDMNAHTSTEPDFSPEDDHNHQYICLPDDYEADAFLNRRNMDKTPLNEHGKSLLDICSATGQRILSFTVEKWATFLVNLLFMADNVNNLPPLIMVRPT